MANPNTPTIYKGQCHCASLRFTLMVPHPIVTEDVHTCNCSLCVRKGYLATFTLPVESLVWTKYSEKDLQIYKFGGKAFEHLFCRVCGTTLFGTAEEGKWKGIYVSVRLLQGVDGWELEKDCQQMNGAAFGEPWKPHAFDGEVSKGEESDGTKIYYGSCHCGNITLALRSKPFPEVEIKEDNCSLCRRNKNVMVYPNKDEILIRAEEDPTVYFWGRKYTGSCFCGTCGVHVYGSIKGPDEEEMVGWSEERKKMVEAKRRIVPVRIAVLEGVEWEDLKVARTDDGAEGYVFE